MLNLVIRDRREKGWFYLDNEYLNGYAKVFGPVGTAIYVCLCRHVDNGTQQCWPSLETIAEECGIGSLNTVRKYLSLFEDAGILVMEKHRDLTTQKWLNTVYTLLDKSQWKSHAQPVTMDSHAQLVSESHCHPVTHKETQNTKETKIPASRIFPVLEESEEKENGRAKTTKPKDKVALALREKCYRIIEKDTGVRPTATFADYSRVSHALTLIGEKGILTMVEDALSVGKVKDLCTMLTTLKVDAYRRDIV